jgi:hypothetical protein
MRKIELRGSVLAAAAAIATGLLLGGASAASAHGGEDGACHAECSEARAICQRAAQAAFKACRAECSGDVEEAAQRARAACQEGGLGLRACVKLLHEAVHDAVHACRDDCKSARELARTLCSEEREECREACVAGLDPQCVEGCRAAFDACRSGLETCAQGCRAAFEAAREQCAVEAAAGGACDIEVYRECVARAREEALLCAEGCHEAHPCAHDLRQCLGECAPADGNGEGGGE